MNFLPTSPAAHRTHPKQLYPGEAGSLEYQTLAEPGFDQRETTLRSMHTRRALRGVLFLLVAAHVLPACGKAAVDIPAGPPLIPPPLKSVPASTPSPTSALDTCLFGEWQVVDASLAEYLARAIMGSQTGGHELLGSSGELSLFFSEGGELSMRSQHYQVSLVLRSRDSSNQESWLRISMAAGGTARWEVSGEKLLAFQPSYDAFDLEAFPLQIGETGVRLTPLRLHPGWFINRTDTSADAGEGTTAAEAPRYTAYRCSATSLQLAAEPFGPLQFERQTGP